MPNNTIKNLGTIISGIGGLMSETAPVEDNNGPNEGEARVTLRYASQRVDLLPIESVLSSTVRDLFRVHAASLGLPGSGDLAVRSSGLLVDPDEEVGEPRSFTASVARETKGS